MSGKGDGTYIDLAYLSKGLSWTIIVLAAVLTLLAYGVNYYFYIPAVPFYLLICLEIYYKKFQKSHSILRNFGLFGMARYMMESVGPELRQYWIASDTEEKPFSRRERAEVYKYSKGITSTAPFGTLEVQKYGMIRHSMFPKHVEDIPPFSLTFGEERGIENQYTITKPFMVSAMSFGALGEHAVRAIARGAKKGGIPMNTGEGGYPKYHLMEGPDIIFQMGTAKFGVRNDDGTLNDDKLKELAANEHIKMIEIKFSQGAKPGKGGMLPGSKVSEEIAELRGVPIGKTIHSPEGHAECDTVDNTIKFIKRVQDVSGLPVGMKICFGREDEFTELIHTMKSRDVFPDYLVIDGAEGGTGAAPRSFMDYVGIPLFRALNIVTNILEKEKVRGKFKLVASGKLINPARQLTALAYGADACYTARGFMLAIGCIQALQCNTDTCPVGITTHDKHLQNGLDIEQKSDRVFNYINKLYAGTKELLAATGLINFKYLYKKDVIFKPWEID